MTAVSNDPDRDARIVAVLFALGPGEVTTYGDIAETAGYPGRARLVGRLLATTDEEVPWWRVVTSDGRLVPGHEREQTALLKAEGVGVRSGHVAHAPVGRFSLPDPLLRRGRP